ncbi:MAG: hypothetical protein ACI8Q1_003256 [Parvicella sp.]|jgi:hypothetical protein
MINILKLTLLIIGLHIQAYHAQLINDVIKIEGKYYVMTPSPSQFYSNNNSSYCRSSVVFRGEYELKNDKLFFVKLLSISASVVKSDLSFLELPLPGQHITTNEKYWLNTIDNIDKVRKTLTKRVYEYALGGSKNTSSLEFVNGDIKRVFYSVDSTESYTGYGMLNYYRYNQDTTSVDIVRIKDSLVMFTFSSSDEYIINELNSYRLRNRPISYARTNYRYQYPLPAGEYVLQRVVDGVVENSDTCKIVVGSETEINFNIKNPKPILIIIDTLRLRLLDYEGIGLDLEYGNNQVGNLGAHELNMFGFGLYSTKEKFIGIRNQTSFIGAIGGRYAYGIIHPDSNVLGLDNFKLQNYSYLSLLVKGSARVYLTKYKHKQQTRLFLEAGLGYNLPIVYRYVARYKGDKYSSKWIHQLNDVSAFGKIGFHKGMSIMASYRPFNIVKSPYPQLSQFTIGFSYSVYL